MGAARAVVETTCVADSRATKKLVAETLRRFATNVRNRREELHLTQESLAEKAGCSTATISLLERAQRAPSFGLMIGLAMVLDRPLSLLLGEAPAGAADVERMVEIARRVVDEAPKRHR